MSICTEPFRVPAQAMAEVYGMPEFPFIVMPHPIASLTEAEIQHRVRAFLPQVLRILGAGEGAS